MINRFILKFNKLHKARWIFFLLVGLLKHVRSIFGYICWEHQLFQILKKNQKLYFEKWLTVGISKYSGVTFKVKPYLTYLRNIFHFFNFQISVASKPSKQKQTKNLKFLVHKNASFGLINPISWHILYKYSFSTIWLQMSSLFSLWNSF